VGGRAGKARRTLVPAKIREINVRLNELVYSPITLPSGIQAGQRREHWEGRCSMWVLYYSPQKRLLHVAGDEFLNEFVQFHTHKCIYIIILYHQNWHSYFKKESGVRVRLVPFFPE
jgi:hypothetical protein